LNSINVVWFATKKKTIANPKCVTVISPYTASHEQDNILKRLPSQQMNKESNF